jgi:hypothetical protein
VSRSARRLFGTPFKASQNKLEELSSEWIQSLLSPLELLFLNGGSQPFPLLKFWWTYFSSRSRYHNKSPLQDNEISTWSQIDCCQRMYMNYWCRLDSFVKCLFTTLSVADKGIPSVAGNRILANLIEQEQNTEHLLARVVCLQVSLPSTLSFAHALIHSSKPVGGHFRSVSTPVVEERTNPEPDVDTLCISMRFVLWAFDSYYIWLVNKSLRRDTGRNW